MQSLRGKKTYILAVVALITAWATFAVGDISLGEAIEATFGALGAMTIRSGITSEMAKKTGAALLIAALAVGCASTGPSEQLAGQAPVRGTAAAFNSMATTEASTLGASPFASMSEGVDLPVLNKDGTVVLDGSGNPVYVKMGRGLRDVNFFFGEVNITAETTVSGTQSGAAQDNRPTTTNSPDISATIPTSAATAARPIIPAPTPPIPVPAPPTPVPPASGGTETPAPPAPAETPAR